MSPPAPPGSTLRVRVYTTPVRLAAAILLGASRASLPVLLLLVVGAADPPVTPPVLVRLVAVLAVLPGLAAWALGRAAAAALAVEGGDLVLRARTRRIEIPCAAIAEVVPWALPLPGPGLDLRLRSERRLAWRLQVEDPGAVLERLAAAGVAAARAAGSHPTVVWARARGGRRGSRGARPAIKFGVFPLVPAAVLFYTHQHIAYGALLGQWYLEGRGPWLATLGLHWLTTAIYCVLYASVWRGLAEGAALAAARFAPSQAARVRRAAEIGCLVLYWGGVPALLVARYLA
jgi:hypothetical protein